jgi:hypothetical protein
VTYFTARITRREALLQVSQRIFEKALKNQPHGSIGFGVIDSSSREWVAKSFTTIRLDAIQRINYKQQILADNQDEIFVDLLHLFGTDQQCHCV